MKKLLSATGLAVALILFLVFNIFTSAALKSSRLDLTENKLYTLSEGTRNVLAHLQEPIKLRLYFSKKLANDIPQVQTYAERVQEYLEEYVAHSGGKLTLEVSDPEPFSEEEDRAVGFGLQGVPATAGGEQIYFGLVGTNTTDQEETIPFFQQNREEFLEYDITKLVYNLSNTKKHVIGLITKLPMEGNPMARMQNPNADVQPWFILDEIRKLFEVRTLAATTDKIDPDVDVLMIVHPQGLAPQTLFAIDQFVLGGGKVLAFVDPHCEAQEVRNDPQNPMAAMMANRSSDLGPLLGAWGLDMSKDDVAADRESALRVNYANQPTDFIVWLGLRKDKVNFSKDDFVTSQLDTVNIISAGVLKKKDGATTAVAPLLETSKNAMREPKSSLMMGPDPVRLLESFVSGDQKLMLAARVSGPAHTAYPDGKPKAPEPPPSDGAPPPAPDKGDSIEASKGPINVIVVADADMLEDRFWTRTQNFFGQHMAIPTANNADFVVNALDNLSGSNDLISLRSRGKFQRPFEKVAEIRRAAETSFHQKEKSLEDKLKDTEQKISELQNNKEGKSSMILSPEQQKEIERFRDERIATRKELRRVKHDMQKDIEDLGTKLKFANVFLIPILVVIAAISLWAVRSNRKVV